MTVALTTIAHRETDTSGSRAPISEGSDVKVIPTGPGVNGTEYRRRYDCLVDKSLDEIDSTNATIIEITTEP